MKPDKTNIFPIHNELLSRSAKEVLLKQRGLTVWITGLSGSGKTTIAKVLEKELHETGILTKVLDGDNVRDGINKNLGFSPEDRLENVRRVAEINKILIETGVVVINCFVSPLAEMRALARSIVGTKDFVEVFVDTPLSACESRDVKGLYAKARKGLIKNFTGIDAPFEAPVNAEITLKTENTTAKESAHQLTEFLLPKIKHS